MQGLDFRGVNFATTSGLLTATGAVTTHDTTVAIAFCVNGRAFSKAAITTGTTPLLDAVTGVAPPALTASKARVAVWCLTAAGAVSVVHGENVDWDGTNPTPQMQFPNIPNTLTPFAYQILKASAAAGSIVFGTSNWNATGFTNAISNVMVLPEHPQTA
jgi:hypothetical protein